MSSSTLLTTQVHTVWAAFASERIPDPRPADLLDDDQPIATAVISEKGVE
jgi:hypothetical protein